jgi:hypothetical protein
MPDPDLTWLQSISLWQLAGGVLALIALIAFIRKGWPWLRAAVHLLETLGTLAEDMASLKTNVAAIKHEVLPNGGSSLKDQATRTETAVGKLTSEVAHIRRQQAATKTTLTRTEKRLAEHLTPSKEQL